LSRLLLLHVLVPLGLERFELVLQRSDDRRLQPVPHAQLDRGEEQLPVVVDDAAQALGVVPEPIALTDAGEHELALLRDPAGQVGADLQRRHQRGGRDCLHLVVADDVIEGVVPEIRDLERRVARSIRGFDQLLRQVGDPVDVVVVDVADEDVVERQRRVGSTPVADLLEPGADAALVDAGRPGVHDRELEGVGRAEVEEQCVPVSGLECLEREDHGVPPQTIWRARSTSSMPAPWK
jgi:hypothetical protein